MYQRDPDTAPKLSEDQRQAREYLVQAEEAEGIGDITGAMLFYKRAYKLDPELESNGT